jgi:hypothetical protein
MVVRATRGSDYSGSVDKSVPCHPDNDSGLFVF